MKRTLFDTMSGERVLVTDEHPASSHGIPVLLVQADEGLFVLGAGDEVLPGLPARRLAELFLAERLPAGASIRRARRTPAAVAACEQFLEAGRPLVVRIPTPGYVAVPYGGMIGSNPPRTSRDAR
mgnify:CR=1 FL=1